METDMGTRSRPGPCLFIVQAKLKVIMYLYPRLGSKDFDY